MSNPPSEYCTGYYIKSGTTTEVRDADFIKGDNSLYPFNVGPYTFDIIFEEPINEMYLFLIHCDGVEGDGETRQGGYQVKRLDLTCDDCVK